MLGRGICDFLRRVARARPIGDREAGCARDGRVRAHVAERPARSGGACVIFVVVVGGDGPTQAVVLELMVQRSALIFPIWSAC
eukprot:7378184-Prymnesium_polylepis.2